MSKKISLEVVNPYAAGIDVGSRSHWVAVGQDAQSVKEFGVYTKSIYKIVQNILNYFGLNQGEKRSSSRSYRRVFSTMSKPKRNKILD